MVADADCSRGLFTVYQKKAKNKLLVGYIIDEAAHHKNGKKSVGARWQYAGIIGKVDNCQVGVYASLLSHTASTIINGPILIYRIINRKKK